MKIKSFEFYNPDTNEHVKIEPLPFDGQHPSFRVLYNPNPEDHANQWTAEVFTGGAEHPAHAEK